MAAGEVVTVSMSAVRDWLEDNPDANPLPRELEIPGGTLSGPFLKDGDHYLSNARWVGDALPKSFMGIPWGLGGDCWYVIGYRERRRKHFAGMDPAVVLAAAFDWVTTGEIPPEANLSRGPVHICQYAPYHSCQKPGTHGGRCPQCGKQENEHIAAGCGWELS